ncbi:MAG: hypothetical protein D6722_03650 [Bacteroidetes bacterium]|nr:MAG: hypothetical protein D6722_03650 [Bacteroidota bacterium]
MPWHPFLVHFPLALLVVAGLAYLASLRSPDPFWARSGYLLHLAGLAGLVLATLSGRQAEAGLVMTEAIRELLQTHELMGYGTLWAFALLLVWRYLGVKKPQSLTAWAFGLVFWAMIGLMAWGGWYGGRLVYQEGAGVAPMRPHLEQQLKPDSP